MKTQWKENVIDSTNKFNEEIKLKTEMISTDLTESILDIADRQYVGLWKVNNSNAKTTV